MAHAHFLNSPKSFVVDALRGTVAATDDLEWHPEPGYLTRRQPLPTGQVALLSGGGSGHEPLHAGFVGRGMLTGACPGLVFSSPNALQVRAATKAVEAGGGVVHIVKNYTGDVLNFRIAGDMAEEDGIAVEHVLVDDDVASDRAGGPGRRGTAATIAVEKICGASAERGDDLGTVAELGRRTARNSRSMAVALRPCTVPGADAPSFDLPDGQIEIGIGIHGERGTERTDSMPAAKLVRRLADPVIAALDLKSGDPVIAIVNGLGGTPALELHLLFGELVDYLAEKDVVLRRSLVGSFVTALDMEGASITLVRCDDELLELWDAPTAAPGWPNAPTGEFAGIAAVSDTGFRSAVASREGAADVADTPDSLGRAAVGRWIGTFVERVLAEEPNLTDLDRRAGDGDFGTNMVAALDHVDVDKIRGTYSPATIFESLSDAYLSHAGGTSGALFGIWFRQFYRAATDSGGGLDLEAVTTAARQGLDTIRELGGAQRGDKTMIDAIEPAVVALESAVDTGGGLLDGLADAADAATRGAEATAGITASRGRASYVGEASRGIVDPGALVSSWFFVEAREAARTLG
ncbi:dihydroxyacetone kinase subunit DhaL [Rhodococcus tibetensis]|uniref:Dihydroxyacetone kinase subunit DhaL n=1 Tax=Rhodococcus tibetensis TaxID=2965064 RepID=A0ABT1QEI3_9NOCA|nr:dihydroxyacetone kinase subunit DhaL [Rhodococcus sp. FXJ9.536]MCQ4120696.1 dihydroxyacetone kinase subunit DhaL [Rhodococcus sp. FXJ9.536]